MHEQWNIQTLHGNGRRKTKQKGKLNALRKLNDRMNKLCGRPPQCAPPLWPWPFDLESGVRVTCDVGYLCANFSLPMPLCSRLRPKCTPQTDVRRTGVRHHHRLMPPLRGRRHNKRINSDNNGNDREDTCMSAEVQNVFTVWRRTSLGPLLVALLQCGYSQHQTSCSCRDVVSPVLCINNNLYSPKYMVDNKN